MKHSGYGSKLSAEELSAKRFPPKSIPHIASLPIPPAPLKLQHYGTLQMFLLLSSLLLFKPRTKSRLFQKIIEENCSGMTIILAGPQHKNCHAASHFITKKYSKNK